MNIAMQKKIHFTKMHGLGNDFVVINATHQAFDLTSLSIVGLADRHTGIGFDQLLIIQPSDRANYFCRIFNADGSEAEQCGNGLRCVARFLHETGFSSSSLQLETKAGIFPIAIKDYDHIRVTMGVPHIQNNLVELPIKNTTQPLHASVLSLGNPHAIIKVESVDTVRTDQLGAEISTHVFFPQGANVGFMQIVNQNHIRLRTFERGVGETLACGSNACAAICAGIVNGWLGDQVKVEFRHGDLWIEWDREKQLIHMTGPAAYVFSGEFLL